MEFGKLAFIENINWDLPTEDPHTEGFLTSLKSTAQPKIYIGAPAWGCKEWVGRIYPPKTAPADFLFHYSRNFNCIELNTTHYQIPTSEKTKSWIAKVPSGFVFCPKISQQISHDPGGLRDQASLNLWLKSLENFGDFLGPCFLQLPPDFSYADKAELFNFLKAWPSHFPLSLEFRHASWFKNGHLLPALVEYLLTRHIGLVITDVAGRRDVLHTSVSAPFSMLRLIGNNLHPSDFVRAHKWSEQVKKWQSLGLQKFFFIVHEPDDIKTPEMTERVIHDLNQICHAGLTPLARPLISTK